MKLTGVILNFIWHSKVIFVIKNGRIGLTRPSQPNFTLSWADSNINRLIFCLPGPILLCMYCRQDNLDRLKAGVVTHYYLDKIRKCWGKVPSKSFFHFWNNMLIEPSKKKFGENKKKKDEGKTWRRKNQSANWRKREKWKSTYYTNYIYFF